MEEEKIYKTILTKTDGTYLGWNPAVNKDGSVGAGMSVHDWDKPLPVDIDDGGYTLAEGELIKDI